MSRDFEKRSTAEIKRELVDAFAWPFSVTRGRGTGRHWLRVRWTNGPTTEQVDRVLAKHNDSKNDDITTDLWVGCQYTNTTRDIEPEGAWVILGGLDLRKGLPPLWELIQAAGTMACRRNDADGWAAGENWLELRRNAARAWALPEYTAAFEALGYCCTIEEKADGWKRYAFSAKSGAAA